MGSSSRKRKPKGSKKVRVAFRRNRSKPPRITDWTTQANQAEDTGAETKHTERIVAKGDLSRHRTVIVPDDQEAAWKGLSRGTVVAMHGLYADVDDGQCIRSCTVRRILRTQLIEERHPVTVGDHVRFRIQRAGRKTTNEGVIQAVEPRTGQLRRRSGRRIQTIVANVDQAIIVASVQEPTLKPNLIDRYIVSALVGDITPIICINKVDLDADGVGTALLERYRTLGYTAIPTSAMAGIGIDTLTGVLKDKASVIAGQSGVGKSSLLNAVQPGLNLKTKDVMERTRKGRHTTTTSSLIRLNVGGYVVDTPGIRSFDLTIIPREEFEAYFVEFVDRLRDCKFPDCTHTHEVECAIKAAVEDGEIHPERYRSYVQMFQDPGVMA